MICGWDTSIKVKPYYYIPVKAAIFLEMTSEDHYKAWVKCPLDPSLQALLHDIQINF